MFVNAWFKLKMLNENLNGGNLMLKVILQKNDRDLGNYNIKWWLEMYIED